MDFAKTNNYHNSVAISVGILSAFSAGCIGLIYELLWLRKLRLFFGATSWSTATVLTAFFSGFAAGSYFWGKRAESVNRPLSLFSFLCFGLGFSSLLVLLLPFSISQLYHLFGFLFDKSISIVIGVKLFLSLSLLFLPSFFIGGLFPVIAFSFIGRNRHLGLLGSTLYAADIFGAATGALLGGFLLPSELGFIQSYIVIFCITLAIGTVILVYARVTADCKHDEIVPGETKTHLDEPEISIDNTTVLIIAAMSGFIVLSLEVIWVHMMAQVVENSVFAFSVIMATLLVALGIGALGSRVISRKNWNPSTVLFFLFLISAFAILVTSSGFMHYTGSIPFASRLLGLKGYFIPVLGIALAIVLVPAIFIGTIFPYLFHCVVKTGETSGVIIGRLVCINTLGGIFGSLVTGFVLLGTLEVWWCLCLLAVLYSLLALFMITRHMRNRRLLVMLPAIQIVLIIVVMALPQMAFSYVPLNQTEQLVERFIGRDATVTVLKRGKHYSMRVNRLYTVGGTSEKRYEQLQANLPLMLHPDPQKVFLIGMGTGITAGGALYHPVKKLVVTEINPEIVKAARKYFSPYVNNLFDDSRVEIKVEDGRHYLQYHTDSYDVIIGDLFYPEKARDLYTLEHFKTVRSRLKAGGIYAQWLPLYQLQKEQFFSIVKTMLTVFPQVTLWRCDFSKATPAMALIAHDESVLLDSVSIRINVKNLVKKTAEPDGKLHALPYIYYVGNMTGVREIFEDYPLNTDNKSSIEHLKYKSITASDPHFTSLRLAEFCDTLVELSPFESDPYVSNAGVSAINSALAGFFLFKHRAYYGSFQKEISDRFYDNYLYYLGYNPDGEYGIVPENVNKYP